MHGFINIIIIDILIIRLSITSSIYIIRRLSITSNYSIKYTVHITVVRLLVYYQITISKLVFIL